MLIDTFLCVLILHIIYIIIWLGNTSQFWNVKTIKKYKFDIPKLACEDQFFCSFPTKSNAIRIREN